MKKIMQITTYREIYQTPVRSVTVPTELQKDGFEVHFMPLFRSSKTVEQAETKKQTKQTDSKGGAGSIMRAYFADVPPPSCDEEDFVLPSRKDNNYKPVDFD